MAKEKVSEERIVEGSENNVQIRMDCRHKTRFRHYLERKKKDWNNKNKALDEGEILEGPLV